MNIQEMHIGVNLGVQKIASNLQDNLLSQEVDYYLNESIDQYIEQQYSFLKSEDRDPQAQAINENLNTILSTTTISNVDQENAFPNAISFNLPANYRFHVFSRTKIVQNDPLWITNRLLQPKGVKDYLTTEYNEPVFREFPLMIQSASGQKRGIVIGDSRHTLSEDSSVYFTYIENPVRVDFVNEINCNLPEHTHVTIVNMTVRRILQALNVGVEQ